MKALASLLIHAGLPKPSLLDNAIRTKISSAGSNKQLNKVHQDFQGIFSSEIPKRLSLSIFFENLTL